MSGGKHLSRRDLVLVAGPPALQLALWITMLLVAEEPWRRIAEGRERPWYLYLFPVASVGLLVAWVVGFARVAKRLGGGSGTGDRSGGDPR